MILTSNFSIHKHTRPFFMAELRYLIAFSGGLDSTVLTHHFMRELKHYPEIELQAIHVHHGLQSQANNWVKHCQSMCLQWQLPLHIAYVDAQPQPGESPEAAARTARYQALNQHIDDRTVLVTGHHQNDQAETVLLQLLRGAGSKGLRGMPEWKVLQRGWHYRPLLHYSRQQLVDLATAWQLTWIEDPSNDNRQYARNALRHEILPSIARYWPGYDKTLTRSATLLAQSEQLLQQFAYEQLQQLGATQQQLPLKTLLTLGLDRQALLVRHWLALSQHPMPSAAKLKQFLIDLAQARPERHPRLDWATLSLYRYRHNLCWKHITAPNTNTTWPHFPQPLLLNSQHHVTAQPTTGGLRNLSTAEIQSLTVRYWHQGGRFHPHDRHHSQTIKKLLQAWHIPMELRRQIPFVYCGTTLIAIVGFGIAKDWYSEGLGWHIGG